MKLIVISLPQLFEGEVDVINKLFAAGMERFHLRKPDASSTEIKALINGIEPAYRQQITIHYHLALAQEYSLGGVHLNVRAPLAPDGWKGLVSCSCHTISELTVKSDVDYQFLSPIFDSISKQGYQSGFDELALAQARDKHIINQNVIALGGITPELMPSVKKLGFGGVAVLGALWLNAEGNRLSANEIFSRYAIFAAAANH